MKKILIFSVLLLFCHSFVVMAGGPIVVDVLPAEGSRVEHWQGPVQIFIEFNEPIDTTSADGAIKITHKPHGSCSASILPGSFVFSVDCNKNEGKNTKFSRIVFSSLLVGKDLPAGEIKVKIWGIQNSDGAVMKGDYVRNFTIYKRIPFPRDVRGIVDPDLHVRLDWQPVNEAVAYRIYRNDFCFRETEKLFFEDETVTPGMEYKYSVSAVDKDSEESFPSEKIRIITKIIIRDPSVAERRE